MLIDKKYQALVIDLNIIHYPQLLKYSTNEIRECLSAIFFTRSTKMFSITMMYQHLAALHKFYSDKPACKERYAATTFNDWLSNKNNLLQLLLRSKEALFKHSDTTDEQSTQALKLLSYISNEQLQTMAVIVTHMLTTKNPNGQNALMTAALYEPTAIPMLLKLISTLSESQQLEILTAKNQCGKNALMLTARYQPRAIESLVVTIATLSESQQLEILTAKNQCGKNALMLTARYQPRAIESLVVTIATLPKSQQLEILTAKDHSGNNALMLVTLYNYYTVSMLMGIISNFKPSEQCFFLKQSPRPKHFDSEKEVNELITTMITTLDDKKSLENKIKESLQAMKFNAQNKQLLVLDALTDLKKTYGTETKMAIEKAINDNNSLLYRALNTHRYGFFALNGETASIKGLKQIAGPSFNTDESSKLSFSRKLKIK